MPSRPAWSAAHSHTLDAFFGRSFECVFCSQSRRSIASPLRLVMMMVDRCMQASHDQYTKDPETSGPYHSKSGCGGANWCAPSFIRFDLVAIIIYLAPGILCTSPGAQDGQSCMRLKAPHLGHSGRGGCSCMAPLAAERPPWLKTLQTSLESLYITSLQLMYMALTQVTPLDTPLLITFSNA